MDQDNEIDYYWDAKPSANFEDVRKWELQDFLFAHVSGHVADLRNAFARCRPNQGQKGKTLVYLVFAHNLADFQQKNLRGLMKNVWERYGGGLTD